MEKEIREGWITCPSCHKKYYVTKEKFPISDIGHYIECEKCRTNLGWVPKGTDDYRLQSEEELKELNSTPTCPKCGSSMVKRKGYSEFWGCSRYPSCNGTREV